MIRQEFLKAVPQHAPVLAELQGRKWRHLYGNWNAAAALRDFEAENGDGTLPATIAALEGEVLLGSVSVIFDDLPGYEHLNPWLASLFVLPEHRKGGVGSFLVRAAEDVLRRNGVERSYLFTESTGAYFRRHGWTFVENTLCNGHPVEILTKEVGGFAG